MAGSTPSRALAEALGLGDFDRVGGTMCDPGGVDLEALRAVTASNGEDDVVNRWRRLEDAGFVFYFLPNG